MVTKTLEVIKGEAGYTSKLVTKVPFQRGDIIGDFGKTTATKVKAYTSVQVDVDSHIELNSDFVYLYYLDDDLNIKHAIEIIHVHQM